MGKYRQIVEEIKLRAAQFDHCNFMHEGRASNFEAHNLAKFVIANEVGRYTWLDTPYSIQMPVNILNE
jgi:hypothetical protein